ncbi:MAG: hypothetical protein GPJ54_10345 [Candidatus Heimdallarchaeota archaeon]|nr:hypothetical protein [Candidatus Heimdallarchaeota archaeon]
MDLVIQVGSVGNFIQWNVDDESPDKYVIIKEGKILKSGYWQTGVIEFNVDFLETGSHTIILTTSDLYGNNNSDSVTVTIYDPTVEEGMSIPHILNQYEKTLRNELENTKSTLDMIDTQHARLLQVFEKNSKNSSENLVSKYSREITLLADRKLYLNNSIEGIELHLEQLLAQQGKIKTS